MHLLPALLLLTLTVPFGQAQSPPSPVAGVWEGSIAAKLRLVFTIESSEQGLRGSLKSLDQGNVTIPVESVKLNGGRQIVVEMTAIRASYEGTLTEDGSEIRGQWKQGPTTLPLILRRPGAAATSTLKPVTKGKLPLTPCQSLDKNTEGLCGNLEVFENRQTRAGRKLILRFMLLPAKSAKPELDPVFLIAGGPGQSAIEAFPSATSTSELQAQRDVILLDQRGTGQSNLLPCEVRNEKDAQSIVGKWLPPDAIAACRVELSKNADLAQYTSAIAADDMNDVRQALGYGKVNLIGGSYGTTAALVYLRRHPDTVRSAVLKAVAPPSYKMPVPFGPNIQASMEHLFADCAAQPKCRQAYPELRNHFLAILDRLDKTPARFELFNAVVKEKQPITLSRGMFVANMRPLLYVPQVVRRLPTLIEQAYLNKWDQLGSVMYQVNSQVEKGIARGMSMAVVCAENVSFIKDADVREASQTWLGTYLIQQYRDACRDWPSSGLEKGFSDPVRSNVPVLLISGEYDPATPPSAMKEAAQGLTNATQVVLEKGTHGSASPCIDKMMLDFVTKASASGINTRCAEPNTEFTVP